jgi:hypothetical protein
MFSLEGRSFLDGDTGKQLLLTLFEAEDERYRWLNRAFCVLEGLIDRERGAMRARVYACQHELE